ncbi:MAG TPA: type I DNA topoisomerase [Cyclobacteriaceae bacterium]|nr:type I DNA topoisomerase [Cyclobacteriaceae bacterium]HMV10743.1 type I DNA topoisomerase [Cyclobacteriaceae bacterium]HMV90830.1 type I DNA topoisomerase [Cyclobacteriaceae bacterium]HMX01675.1 type I DNA topoisomerase [Cyclobacteriaceae bacterium]HMX51352.1 type I DNA topoisomerase [Cyclobacteriaceae bacterium]
MAKNLVIVESPAKAKTIEGYLGKDFKVSSSMGHIRDLPKGGDAIDVENNYEPTYEVSPDKKDVIAKLKQLAEDAEMVYLASDEDREGEAISWHLKEVLDLNDKKTRRIVFTEITKKAILNALESPRGIDVDLVNAQQARRVLDRLVGYELSPILWKKIKTGLSAGRVQSVAVRLIVDRERAINEFQSKSSFKVKALFILEGKKHLIAELPKKFESEEEAMKFLEACKGATYTVKSLEKKPSKRSPSAPFTTSTLQQEASLKLGYSVIRTMTVAQKLYEAGKISYMRTDSVNLSEDAIKAATDQIAKNYGQQYVHERRFQTKSSGAQEAHEAIRPTDFSVTNVGSDEGQQRLYDLIWKRAIASQMANAEIEKTVATIGISTTPETLTASGEVITFDGFLKVYMESSDEDEDDDAKNMLPPITVGQVLNLGDMKARQEFSRPPSRYTEASLVKKLEELGIGRPSTYAPTITTIQKREYVVKEIREGKERNYKVLTLKDDNISQEVLTEITGAEKNKLFPTNTAMVVNDFLVEHFPDITDFSFTSEIEQEFDEIATGKLEWKKMIDNFYRPFHKKVLVTEKVERSAAGKNRELGVDPKTGKNVYVKLGKFGAYVQVGENPDDNGGEKPKFASLRPGQFIENITLEDALELMKLPRQMGDFEEKPVVVAIGRFGPYVSHDKKFVSIPKDLDPYTISYEKTVELIQNKRIADANRTIKLFAENPDIQVLNGRFGPYIKAGTKNVKIPKDKDPKELTLEECVELAANAPERKGRFGRFAAKKTEAPVAEKKAPAKKAAVKKVAAKKTPAKKTAAKKKKSE